MANRKWNLEASMSKLRPKSGGTLNDQFTDAARTVLQDSDVTDEMLHDSYILMADIVRTHGEQFLPIFERLHSEIEAREAKKSLLDTAIRMSRADQSRP